ncbi:MAG: SPASM domain-containing protein [Bacteroidetes bacterium]|nr:SPASM domain-containing protein [Bacteroidota bacterium]
MRYTANKKYLYYLQKFATAKKLKNLALNKYEHYAKKKTLRSFPYKVTIDPSSYCNLRCPACHTGTKHSEMIKPSILKLEDYKTIFNQVKDYTFSIALYNWGEPFLNKEIFEIISYTKENNVGSTLHSNFNVFNEKMADELLRSGLTHIYMSIDGATQDVYNQYRIKGNLEKVLYNIKLLTEAKAKHKSIFPLITWKYLTFSHNEHQVKEAEQIAKSLNVNNYETFVARPKLNDIYDDANEYKNNPAKMATLKFDCASLWQSVYISPKGKVSPCSLAFRENESFGNLLESDFLNVWNNSNYQNARGVFTNSTKNDEVPLPCKGCKFYFKACSLGLLK